MLACLKGPWEVGEWVGCPLPTPVGPPGRRMYEGVPLPLAGRAPSKGPATCSKLPTETLQTGQHESGSRIGGGRAGTRPPCPTAAGRPRSWLHPGLTLTRCRHRQVPGQRPAPPAVPIHREHHVVHDATCTCIMVWGKNGRLRFVGAAAAAHDHQYLCAHEDYVHPTVGLGRD